MLKCLNAVKARYLLVGAYAVSAYTEPRYTKDLDIWVDASPDNAKKVYEALKMFKAPLINVTENDFSEPGLVYQIGVEPVRIDILMSISGVTFDSAWKHKTRESFGDTFAHVIGMDDLIKAKEAASRPKDKIDLKQLKKKKTIQLK